MELSIGDENLSLTLCAYVVGFVNVAPIDYCSMTNYMTIYKLAS